MTVEYKSNNLLDTTKVQIFTTHNKSLQLYNTRQNFTALQDTNKPDNILQLYSIVQKLYNL